MEVPVSSPDPHTTHFAHPSLCGGFQSSLSGQVPEGLHESLWSMEQLDARAGQTLPGCGAEVDKSATLQELRRLHRAQSGVTWLLFPPQRDFGRVTSPLGFVISNWP